VNTDLCLMLNTKRNGKVSMVKVCTWWNYRRMQGRPTAKMSHSVPFAGSVVQCAVSVPSALLSRVRTLSCR